MDNKTKRSKCTFFFLLFLMMFFLKINLGIYIFFIIFIMILVHKCYLLYTRLMFCILLMHMIYSVFLIEHSNPGA